MIEYLYFPSIITLIILVISYIFSSKKSSTNKTNPKEHESVQEKIEKPEKKPEQPKGKIKFKNDFFKEKKYSLKELKKMAAQGDKNRKKTTRTNPTHKCFVNAFKGFSQEITDFSMDEDMIAIASKDKTFRLFSLKELDSQMQQQQKDRVYQSLRNEIRYNYARSIALCKNKKLVACGLCPENTIEIFEWKKEEKKEDNEKGKGVKKRKGKKNEDNTQKQQQPKLVFESIQKFKHLIHSVQTKYPYLIFFKKDDIIGLEFGPNGQFLVSCGSDADTFIKVWALDGTLLQAFNTNQLKHFDFCMSQSKKLCLVGTWQGDSKILELKTDKVEKNFKSIQKVMDLGGHKSKIQYISCSFNSDKVITISNDETMKIWDINVKYELQENAHLLNTFNLIQNQFLPEDNTIPIETAVTYTTQNSPYQTLLAIAYGSAIKLIDFDTMKEIDYIEDACTENDNISRINFIVYQKKLYLLSHGINEQRINIFAVNFQI